jgi:hypothetical protein
MFAKHNSNRRCRVQKWCCRPGVRRMVKSVPSDPLPKPITIEAARERFISSVLRNELRPPLYHAQPRCHSVGTPIRFCVQQAPSPQSEPRSALAEGYAVVEPSGGQGACVKSNTRSLRLAALSVFTVLRGPRFPANQVDLLYRTASSSRRRKIDKSPSRNLRAAMGYGGPDLDAKRASSVRVCYSQ